MHEGIAPPRCCKELPIFSASPILTVSLVTFRTDPAVLRAALDSLATSSVPLAVILVDNTPEDSYFETLPRREGITRVRSPRNGGYGFGHNLALANSTPAPFHLIMNPDVVVHLHCLETLIALMQTQPDLAMTVPLILNPNGTTQHLNRRDPTVLDLALRRFAPGFIRNLPIAQRRMDYFVRTDIGYDTPSEVPNASGCFMLFRRSTLNALNGFDEQFFMYFEDCDISRRASALGRVLFVPDARITHHWARGSHTSFPLMLATLKSAYQYFQKWGWRLY